MNCITAPLRSLHASSRASRSARNADLSIPASAPYRRIPRSPAPLHAPLGAQLVIDRRQHGQAGFGRPRRNEPERNRRLHIDAADLPGCCQQSMPMASTTVSRGMAARQFSML